MFVNMASKIRAESTFNLPKIELYNDLENRFKSLKVWYTKPSSEAVTTYRKRKSENHGKTDRKWAVEDRLDLKIDDLSSQEIFEDDKIKPLSNPNDPFDDFNLFWKPEELLDATKALATYDVKDLYKKNPYTVKNTLNLVFLILKYKPLLKDLLEVREYFQRFPEDEKDEIIVYIALFDLLCRADGITLENEMDTSLRTEYKNIGLKVVYMQLEKDKVHYFEQIHERLGDIGASSVHDLLPIKIPLQINIEFPMIFDVWVNSSGFDVCPEDLVQGAGFKRASTRLSSGLTYNEIADLPNFFELGVSNYSEFAKTSYYRNHVFIPTDRNHCLAMAQVVKQLYQGGITKGTVILTHILSLGATAYFAYLLRITFPLTMKLKVFGADKMKMSFESYFDLLNLKNVKVFSERFYIINCRKRDIASTTCVLVNPETIFNPNLNLVNETINRGCDIVYLQSAYELYSENDVHNNSFIYQYNRDLKALVECNVQRALSIPKVKFIVYQSFNTKETADDNLALNVVKFERECSYTSVVSVTQSMSPTEAEDANYKYCKMLNLYFRQGNTPDNIVSPALWGSKPPFISTIFRVDPVIIGTETEDEINDKYNIIEKRSSASPSIIKSGYIRGKPISKVIYKVKSTTPESRRSRRKSAVGTPSFSTDSGIKKNILNSKVNIKFTEPERRRQYYSRNSESSYRSNLQKGNKKNLKVSSRRGSERSGQPSTVSSVRRSSMSLQHARESPPDFKKMVLSEVMLENELVSSRSGNEEDPVSENKLKDEKYKKTKKISDVTTKVLLDDQIKNISYLHLSKSSISQIQRKQSRPSSLSKENKKSEISNKSLSIKEPILMEDLNITDEVESREFNEISKSTKLSQNKNKQPKPSKSVKRNKIKGKNEKNNNSKNESVLMKDVPSHIQKKSDETSKEVGSSKYFCDIKKNNYLNILEKRDSVKDKALLMYQHSAVNIKEIPNSKTKGLRINTKEITNSKNKDRNLTKKINQSKIVPRNEFNIEKEATTVIQPESSSKKQSKVKIPLKKDTYIYNCSDTNTTHTNKTDAEGTMTPSQKKFVENRLNMKKQTLEEETYSVSSRKKSTEGDSSIKSKVRKPLKFNIDQRKKLNKMEKKFQKEVTHSFQTHFFHTKNQSDVEENFNSRYNRPSSSISLKTFEEISRKVSRLNVIKSLKKIYLKKEALKKRRKKRVLNRTERGTLQKSTESGGDENNTFSTRIDTVLWTDYDDVDFQKLVEKEKNELKNSSPSLSEIDKGDNSSISSSILETDKEEIKPTITTSLPAQNLSINEKKLVAERRTKSKDEKKFKRKVVLEHNDGTQTKPLRKSGGYKVVPKAEIYMSLNKEDERQENKKHYADFRRSTNASLLSKGTDADEELIRVVSYRRSESNKISIEIHKSEEESEIIAEEDADDMIEEGLDIITPMVHDFKIEDPQTILAQTKMYEAGERDMDEKLSANFREFDFDPELEDVEDKYVHSVNSASQNNFDKEESEIEQKISWFQKSEPQEPIRPRAVSNRRRKSNNKSIEIHKSEASEVILEEDSDDMIEEGVDIITPLVEDFEIEDAQTILAQMKMFKAGERDLDKLISTNYEEFVVDPELEDLENIDEEESITEKDEYDPEDKKEIDALNKHLLKFKAKEKMMEGLVDDSEEEGSSEVEYNEKEMDDLLTKFVDNIFVTDEKTEIRETFIENALMADEEEQDETPIHDLKSEADDEEQTDAIKNICSMPRKEWLKMNDELPDEAIEENKPDESKESIRLSSFAFEFFDKSIIEIEFKKTPTDGLSPLAKELYEIRDVVEFYLHSNMVPLDWRDMKDRYDED